MNQDFQDRIDRYLLHGDTMSEEDKAQFLKEIEEDAEKRDLYEFTKNLKAALVSRDQKLKAIAEFQQECKRRKPKRRNLLLWVSGIAAALVIGFFAVDIMTVGDAPDDNVRGGEDVFENVDPSQLDECKSSPNFKTPNDTTDIDTIAKHK